MSDDTVWFRIDAPTWKKQPVFIVVVRDDVIVDCAPYVRKTALGRSWSKKRAQWEHPGMIITRLRDSEA